MPKLEWDKTGEREYETGVSNCALYVRDSKGTYPKGVAWNGISSISESPSGAEANPIYADNIKYLNLISVEEYAATIEAFMYPDEFEECDGTKELTPGVTIGQQERKTFGLAYKTLLGNDTDSDAHGYKIHIIYGALASPSEKSHETVNDSPEAASFSWEINTTPVEVTGAKPTASLEIDSTKSDPTKLAALEKILFGSDEGESATARLPLPDEIKTLMTAS